MAGHDEREAVAGAERARGALGVRMPGQRGELAVGDRLAVGHLPQDLGDGDLELRAPGEVDLDVLERDALAGEIPAHAIGQRVLASPPRALSRADGSSW